MTYTYMHQSLLNMMWKLQTFFSIYPRQVYISRSRNPEIKPVGENTLERESIALLDIVDFFIWQGVSLTSLYMLYFVTNGTQWILNGSFPSC